jgi:hypothetical protein
MRRRLCLVREGEIMEITKLDIIMLQIISTLGGFIIVFGAAWTLAYVADKAITRWLRFIGAWPAVIDALRKRHELKAEPHRLSEETAENLKKRLSK